MPYISHVYMSRNVYTLDVYFVRVNVTYISCVNVTYISCVDLTNISCFNLTYISCVNVTYISHVCTRRAYITSTSKCVIFDDGVDPIHTSNNRQFFL